MSFDSFSSSPISTPSQNNIQDSSSARKSVGSKTKPRPTYDDLRHAAEGANRMKKMLAADSPSMTKQQRPIFDMQESLPQEAADILGPDISVDISLFASLLR